MNNVAFLVLLPLGVAFLCVSGVSIAQKYRFVFISVTRAAPLVFPTVQHHEVICLTHVIPSTESGAKMEFAKDSYLTISDERFQLESKNGAYVLSVSISNRLSRIYSNGNRIKINYLRLKIYFFFRLQFVLESRQRSRDSNSNCAA